MPAAVELQDVSCVFQSGGQSVRAVDRVNLTVNPGEFFTLLGPSGSGKTTCLRMIGGFTLPTSGTILLNGQEVSQLPPYARPVNTVFQDYALFPHMTVLENVAYGLMVKGMPKAQREQKAQGLLEMIRLPDVGNRKPGQLSGGQRQRVALARALVNEPKLLLLDEPLGALDLKLREQMQTELKALQRSLGITFLFITHDQHEALSMSDRIGVFNQGRLEQVASPQEIYNRPATSFVAQFIGAANVLQGQAAVALTGHQHAMLRPEHIQVGQASGAKASGQVSEVFYFGSFVRLEISLPDGPRLQADVPAHGLDTTPSCGNTVHLHWQAQAVHPLAASA
jgi:putative spermidine/putrescine transport system ATP-binding protein